MTTIGNISLQGVPVPVTAAEALHAVPASHILAFKPLVEWANMVDSDMLIRSCHVTDVDYFGKRIGFLKMKVDASLKSSPEVHLPGVVFLRGGAVSVLLILCAPDGTEWVVCCRQPRVPIGRSHFLEIPAGMLDDAGHFAGVAAKELHEETGIVLGDGDLTDLTQLTLQEGRLAGAGAGDDGGDGGRGNDVSAPLQGLYPSVGACDEFLRLYYARRYVSEAYLHSLRGRLAGNAEENERIVLELVQYNKLWAVCPDAKTLASMLLREKLLAAGLLRDAPQTPSNTLTDEALPPTPA